jgi:protein-disulfide isomerase
VKPVLEKYAQRPGDVKVVLKQYPLNSDCNPNLTVRMHVASCDAAAAVVMARAKGTFDKLLDWLFLHQQELSPATVRSAAADIGKIADFSAEYPKAIQEVKADVALGKLLGVTSTPTFFINGKRIPGGGLPPQYFEAAIELELKKAK